MSALPEIIPHEISDRIDHRVILHGISWRDYEALLAMRGESSGIRVAYLQGELELMTPSQDHEKLKKMLARLIEAFAEEKNLVLDGVGSWTIKEEAKKRGLEPDECYVLGERQKPPTIPDIAIEVVWTSGGLNKLTIYQGLGIPEVWFWMDGGLTFHILKEADYVSSERSEKLPDLDPELLARFMRGSGQTQAVREFRKALSRG
jgi:Uma2 family endonuclease